MTGAFDDVQINANQYNGIYNIFSFAIACMGAATFFFFFQTFYIGPKYQLATVTGGLVTLIACYHYFRIFDSFTAAYVEANGKVTNTGIPFNDAYRYVDWLLTVPLLLIELILVMKLEPEQTKKLGIELGVASAVMVALGYPGEIQDDQMQRWIW